MTASEINRGLPFMLPAAWICGVRVAALNPDSAVTRVRHRWINQNPFRSMFWAVQGMAAELSAGAIVMRDIAEAKAPVSMLVVSNQARFTKKARGLITFTCSDGAASREAIRQALSTGEGVTFWMKSTGVDATGDLVSEFTFEWSVKRKSA